MAVHGGPRRHVAALGEFIALSLGEEFDHRGRMVFAENAMQPLKNISGEGLDLFWVNFGARWWCASSGLDGQPSESFLS